MTESGGLGLRPGFAVDLCENKPYGPHEGESWDLSKASDRVTITPLYSVFSTPELELV